MITLVPSSFRSLTVSLVGPHETTLQYAYYKQNRGKPGNEDNNFIVDSVQVIPVAVVLASGRSRTVAEALGLITNAQSLRTIIKPR